MIFIIDTGQPITIIPSDEKIIKSTEIQKTKKKISGCEQKRKKMPGKIPVNIEDENNKQKTEILITKEQT